jgi:Matrixin
MLGSYLGTLRSRKQAIKRHVSNPSVEGLEDRLLLYSTLGDQWTYDSRITYSFMPDGTSVGGVSSVLFQTMNKVAATATWEQQIEQAAALWENVTNVNLALVSDGGEAVGCTGDQQDDPRFGDIRIGAVPLPSGVLAETFLPPPANGGTDAGDIIFNSSVDWGINTNYDIMTVAAHEFGHALGLGESTVSTAVMYGTYNGIKQALTTDDIDGIQSIYGTRTYDQFNQNGTRNDTVLSATNINSYITSSAQIAIPALDISTSGDIEWFTANVPSSTTGTMTVTVQSSNLSSLAPQLQVYNSSLGLVGTAAGSGELGATISVSVSNVTAGAQYYFKVLAAGGAGPIGNYGLLVNFGSQTASPIAPPNTLVAAQPNEGGGTVTNAVWTSIGSLSGWALQMSASGSTSSPAAVAPAATSTAAVVDVVSTPSNTPASVTTGTTVKLTTSTALTVPAPAPLAIGPASVVNQALEDWTSTKGTKPAFGLL